MVLSGQKGLYSGQSCCIHENWLYSGKVVIFGQSGRVGIWVKVVLFGRKWLYSGKSGCIGENGCIRAKVVVFGKKWLYSGKLVVVG